MSADSNPPSREQDLLRRIAELEQDNESLRRRLDEDDLYRSLAEHSGDVIVRTDAVGTVLYVSPSLRAVLGYEPSELVGHLGSDLIHPDDWAEVSRSVLEQFQRERIATVTYRARRKDGTYIWVESNVQAVRDSRTGEFLGSHTTSRDVSQRRRAEEERRRLEEKMCETQKLESLGVLAGGIAHEFNNLLTSILGYAGLSVEQVPAASPVQGFLRQIDEASRRAAELCQQMLAYAGKGRYVVAPLDLGGVVREVAGLMHVSLPRKATLSPRLAERLPPVKADKAQMRQVVMNLVMNASEALPSEGGLVTVSTRAAALDSNRLARMQLGEELPPGEYVGLEVTDTGGGMDEATRARIFEPFFTTKFIGRGLGLSAVLGIVRGHRGALEVDTAPGRGSTFRVWFPAVAEEIEVPASPEASQGAGLALIAEDERGIRHLLELVLREAGFDVVAVADGQEAIDRVSRDPHRFRLALVDLTMPRRDGVEVVAELARLAPELPVILMSGHSAHQVGELLAGRRVAGFLSKPFTHADVIEYLRHLPGVNRPR